VVPASIKRWVRRRSISATVRRRHRWVVSISRLSRISQSLAQISGFSPASVANAYDTQRDIKNYEQAILNRRSSLMDAYALAWRLGDDGARNQVVAKMRAFSTSYPELAITGESIKLSLTSRARASAKCGKWSGH